MFSEIFVLVSQFAQFFCLSPSLLYNASQLDKSFGSVAKIYKCAAEPEVATLELEAGVTDPFCRFAYQDIVIKFSTSLAPVADACIYFENYLL